MIHEKAGSGNSDGVEFSNSGVCYNVFSRWVKTGVIEPEFVNPSGRRYFTREQVDAYFRGEYSTKGGI